MGLLCISIFHMLIVVGDSRDAAVGDLRGLSSNAETMVRIAVLSAWAEIQVASIEQKYLVKVVEPHIAKLTPLWLSSLQEFARLRFEPDISSNAGPAQPAESLDTTYAALNRQTLLKVGNMFLLFIHALRVLVVLSRFMAETCPCYCKPYRSRQRFRFRRSRRENKDASSQWNSKPRN